MFELNYNRITKTAVLVILMCCTFVSHLVGQIDDYPKGTDICKLALERSTHFFSSDYAHTADYEHAWLEFHSDSDSDSDSNSNSDKEKGIICSSCTHFVNTASYVVHRLRSMCNDSDGSLNFPTIRSEVYTRPAMKRVVESPERSVSKNSIIRFIPDNNLESAYPLLDRFLGCEEILTSRYQLERATYRLEKKFCVHHLYNLAYDYFNLGRYDESLVVLNEADELMRGDTTLYLLQSMVYMLRARVAEKTSNENRAVLYFLSAHMFAFKSGSLSHQKHSSAWLSDYYESINQTDNSLIYSDSSVFKANKFHLSQAGYEGESAAEYISQLRNAQAVFSSEENREGLVFTIATLMMVGLTTFILSLYSNTKKMLSNTINEIENVSKTLSETKESIAAIHMKVMSEGTGHKTVFRQISQDNRHTDRVIRDANTNMNTNKDTDIDTITDENEIENERRHENTFEEPANNSKSSEQVAYMLKKGLHDLKSLHGEQMWKEFEIRFKAEFGEFDKRLHQMYPGLTPNERRLSAFLRLGMNTKEIVAITGQSVRAVEMARTRLRKKMKISGTKKNLSVYIRNI